MTFDAEFISGGGATVVALVAIIPRRASFVNNPPVLVQIISSREKLLARSTEETFVEFISNALENGVGRNLSLEKFHFLNFHLFEGHFAVFAFVVRFEDSIDGEGKIGLGIDEVVAVGEGNVPRVG